MKHEKTIKFSETKTVSKFHRIKFEVDRLENKIA